MKIISLFAGGGGMDLGVKQAGFKTNIAVDNNKNCCLTLKNNFPDTEVICDDISNIINSLGKCDLILAGPPCQNFSLINQKRTRDTSNYDLVRNYINEYKPRYYMIENVVGILSVIKDKHYKINCADYGVAQKRKRIVFSNIRLPLPTHSENPINSETKKWVTVGESLGINSIDKNEMTLKQFNRLDHMKRRAKNYNVNVFNKPARTVLASTNDDCEYITNSLNINKEELKTKLPYLISTNTVPKDLYFRKLTINEKQMLQGFPKDYKFYGSDRQQHIQVGNALPPVITKSFLGEINE